MVPTPATPPGAIRPRERRNFDVPRHDALVDAPPVGRGLPPARRLRQRTPRTAGSVEPPPLERAARGARGWWRPRRRRVRRPPAAPVPGLQARARRPPGRRAGAHPERAQDRARAGGGGRPARDGRAGRRGGGDDVRRPGRGGRRRVARAQRGAAARRRHQGPRRAARAARSRTARAARVPDPDRHAAGVTDCGGVASASATPPGEFVVPAGSIAWYRRMSSPTGSCGPVTPWGVDNVGGTQQGWQWLDQREEGLLMAILSSLQRLLDAKNVPYEVHAHRRALTAAEVAAADHVPPSEVAKVVVLRSGEEFVLAVLPATRHLDLERLRALAGDQQLRLA